MVVYNCFFPLASCHFSSHLRKTVSAIVMPQPDHSAETLNEQSDLEEKGRDSTSSAPKKVGEDSSKLIRKVPYF